MRIHRQRHSARQRAGHRRVSTAHAQVRRRRSHHGRAVPRRCVPGHPRSRGRPQRARRIIAAGGYITVNSGAAPDANLIPFQRKPPTPRWTRRLASVAARAWRRAPTRPRNCSRRPRSSTSTCCRRVKPNGGPRREHGRDDGDVLRLVHQPRRVPRACPKEISLDFIAYLNRDYMKSKIKNRKLAANGNVPLSAGAPDDPLTRSVGGSIMLIMRLEHQENRTQSGFPPQPSCRRPGMPPTDSYQRTNANDTHPVRTCIHHPN